MRNKLIVISISLLSLFPGIILLMLYGIFPIISGVAILFSILFFVIYWIKIKNLHGCFIFLVLLNPIIFIPTLCTLDSLIRYPLGKPTLTFCGEPHGKYHPKYRMKTKNDDCDFPLLDYLTGPFKNSLTILLFNSFGYAPGAYLGEMPTQEEITRDFFTEAITLKRIDPYSWEVVSKNNDTLFTDFHYGFMIHDKKTSAPIYKFKFIEDNLGVFGVLDEEEELVDAYVYLINVYGSGIINFYHY